MTFFLVQQLSNYTLLTYVNDQSAYLLCSPGSLTYVMYKYYSQSSLYLFKNTMVNQKFHSQRSSLLHETVCFVIRPHYGNQTKYTSLIRELSRDSWLLLNFKTKVIYYEDSGVVTSWWLSQREIYVLKKKLKVHSIWSLT